MGRVLVPTIAIDSRYKPYIHNSQTPFHTKLGLIGNPPHNNTTFMFGLHQGCTQLTWIMGGQNSIKYFDMSLQVIIWHTSCSYGFWMRQMIQRSRPYNPLRAITERVRRFDDIIRAIDWPQSSTYVFIGLRRARL